jgi:hypothetical protein
MAAKMSKPSKETLDGIRQAVILCAENCYFRAQRKENAIEVVKEEYKTCIDKIIELLEGEVKQ